IKNDQFLAVEGRLLIHRGFTGHACRPHEKSGLDLLAADTLYSLEQSEGELDGYFSWYFDAFTI
ncbi:hypothetical protein EQ831_23670, partial [Pseudomonas sp. ALS1279]